MLLPVQRSEIDEERFGIRVSRSANLDTSNIAAVLDHCAADGVELLIARCPATNVTMAQLLETHGFQIMDTLLYYVADLSLDCRVTTLDVPHVRVIYPGEEEAVVAVARAAFSEYPGHYHADPMLDRKRVGDVYPSWTERFCANRNEASEVIVAECDGVIGGFACLHLNSSEESDGVLFGVDPAYRRRGIFHELLAYSRLWGARKGACRMVYSTQLQNQSVHRTLARSGFWLDHASYTFHKWFGNAAIDPSGERASDLNRAVDDSARRG